MKIRTEHLAHLREKLQPFDNVQNRAKYISAGLTSKRYRWDLTYAAKLTPWICDELYSYMNDTHIDTALRSIIEPLTIGE